MEEEIINLIKKYKLKYLKVSTVVTINSNNTKTFIIDYTYKD